MSGWWLASYLALWALVVVLVLVVVALIRQIGVLHLRLGPRGALELDTEGPPLGEAPEPLALTTLDGAPLDLGGPGARRLVLFVSPGCPLCREVAPAVPALARAHRVEPLIVSDASDAAAARSYDAFGAPVAASPHAFTALNVPGTPYALVLDALGVVRAKGLVNTLEQLEGLVDTAARRERELPVEHEAAP